MKRYLFILLLLGVLMGGSTELVFASSGRQDQGIDLVLLDLSWPDEVNPGDEITFWLTYANKGSMSIPEGTADTTLTLSFLTIDDPTEKIGESSLITLSVADMAFAETRLVTGTLTAPTENDYTVLAEITPLADEVEQNNNSLRKTLKVTSVLPADVANLFAGLAMFSAVMAIVAVGTEVVIDSVRVMLGLKRKVTALEALDQLQDQLPGQLSDLGVSAPKLEEFKGQIKDMKKILEKPVAAADTATLIRDGSLGKLLVDQLSEPILNELAKLILVQLTEKSTLPDATKEKIRDSITTEKIVTAVKTTIEKYSKDSDENLLKDLLADENLKIEGQTLEVLLKDQAENFINLVIDAFKQNATEILGKVAEPVTNWLDDSLAKLKLSDYFQKQLRSAIIGTSNKLLTELEQEIKELKPETVHKSLKIVSGELLQTIETMSLEQGSEAAADWLGQQGDTLVTKGGSEVMGQFDNELKPFLKSLGLSDDHIDKARTELDQTISYLGKQAQAGTTLYIDSLKELLVSVEERRNDMQSPFRKAWRSIRNSSFPAVGAIITVVVVLIGLYLLFSVNVILGLLFIILVGGLVLGLTERIRGKNLKWANGELEKKVTDKTREAFNLPDETIKKAVHDDWKFQIVKSWAKDKDLVAAAKVGEIRQFVAYQWLDYYLTKPEKLSPTSDPAVSEEPRLKSEFKLFGFGDLIFLIESFWNFVIGRPNEEGNVDSGIKDLIAKLDSDFAGTKVAAVLQERTDKHRDEEASRLRWLRVISLIIGIALAYLLQIDAANLLNTVIPNISKSINIFYITLNPLNFQFRVAIPPDLQVLTPGMIITGLAASAGSAFWHDQLDRLQAAKQGAEAAAKLLQEVQGSNIGAGSQK